MKKVLKRVLAAGLVGLMCVGVTACGGSGGGGQAGKNGYLKISIENRGYGTDWLTAMVEEFEKESGINVDVNIKVGASGGAAFDSELESLSSDTDLFITKRGWFAEDVYKGTISAKGQSYDCLYADLSDVWASVVDEGSDLTIADKMNDLYDEAFDIEGKYYALPWAGGVYGLVRNVNVWNDLGLTEEDVPYTTDQLFALCDKVKGDVAPFIYSLEDEYYTAWSPIFFGQYEGVEAVNNFMSGKDPDGEVSQYVYTYDGQVEAIKVIETLMDDANGYQHAKSTSIDFTSMQGQFLNGAALFSVNGSWLENEMGANFASANVDMIKTPVISSIVERLSFKDDAKLVEVIKYVDEVDAGNSPKKPAGVKDEDIAIVTEARHYSYMAGGVDHRAYVPSYSAHIEEAKEFLKFMYSDKGLNIYYETLNGATLPATPVNGYTSEIEMTEFRKSVNKAETEGFLYDREPKSRYYVLSYLSTCFQNGTDLIGDLRAGKTAQDIVNANSAYIDGKWDSIVKSLSAQ